MKLAIKQPYLFPYIGYFQVINLVDKYIIFDDVNYINKGWINRNRILVNNSDHLFTIPLSDSSQNKFIKDSYLVSEHKWKLKFLKTIETSYRQAPQFEVAYTLIEGIIKNNETNLSSFIFYSIKQICDYLGILTTIIPSSVPYNTLIFKNQDKILEICRQEKADEYLDSIGATELYKQDAFRKQGIRLEFLKVKPIEYVQFGKGFIPNLSIIDVIMFNEKSKISQFLNEFELQ
jgi:hypothetical protein